MTKIEWHKVTWYSKLIALIIFVVFPFIGFYYGIEYGEAIQAANQAGQPVTVVASSTPTGGNGVEYYANPAEWQVAESNDGGFSIAYPIDFAVDQTYSTTPTTDWRLGANNVSGKLYFTVTVPSAFEPQTNFADAKLTVGASGNDRAVTACLTPDSAGNPASATSTVVVNGIQFTVFKSSDAGAGNIYETTSYRTLHAGQCYAVEYTIHSSQIANYPSQYNLQPFDENQISSLMDRIVGTFKFN